MPDQVEAESASFIANQLLKIFRKELQNVKKEKREKKRKKEKKSKDDSPAKDARINFRDAVLLLVHVYSLCGPGLIERRTQRCGKRVKNLSV